MDNVFFSLGNFKIKDDAGVCNINKNCYATTQNDSIEISDFLMPKSCITVTTDLIKSCSLFKQGIIDNKKYIEIIHCGEIIIKNKINTKNAEIFIYENHILIIYNSQIFTYYFNYTSFAFVIEIEDNIYIFNDKILVKFNLNLKVFSHFIVVKINLQNLEILCRLPKNINYYFLFLIDEKNNKINIKKLKHKDQKTPQMLPYKLFYLAKNEFEDVLFDIGKDLNNKSLFDYFKQFENIYNLNDKFVITKNNSVCSVNIKIVNDVVVDID